MGRGWRRLGLPPALAIGLVLVPGPASAAPSVRASAVPSVPCGSRQEVTLAAPAGGHAYHSAYFSPTPNEITVTDRSIDDFNALAQKDVAAVVFSDPWGRNGHTRIRFPGGKVRTIWNHGAIPVVRMMPWTKLWVTKNQPVTMQRVIDGRYDGQLLRWFRRAEALGIPMLVEFGVEVNGDWFPWNGRWNGGARTDGYGNPREADGPERFRDAYRHLVQLSKKTGADRIITWGFYVDADGWPRTSWNTPASYYPGRRYVDWLEVSDYGEQKPSGNPSHWFSFSRKLGDPADPHSSYSEIRAIAPDKPIALIEFGVAEDPDAGDKGAWIADAYDRVTLASPGFAYPFDLVSYWSEKWRNGNGSVSDLRVNSSAGALAAYRAGVASDHFVSAPEFRCG